jgi:hypothetical protein
MFSSVFENNFQMKSSEIEADPILGFSGNVVSSVIAVEHFTSFSYRTQSWRN